jgi:ketosteroid isomerase-like protein
MRSGQVVIFLAAALSQGCAPPPAEFSEADQASIAEAVQLRVDGYCQAVLNKDVEYLAGFWADVPGWVSAWDGEIKEGYSFIQGTLQTWAEGPREAFYCSMANSHVYVLGPDAASLATEFEWGMVGAEADTTEAYGSWMYVFARLDGEWRVVHSAGTHLYK